MAVSDSTVVHHLARGVGDTLPLLVGVAPFGLVFGLLGQTTVLGPLGTLAMSAFGFAGSAQFLIAWRTRRTLITIVGGMLAFWTWRLIV